MSTEKPAVVDGLLVCPERELTDDDAVAEVDRQVERLLSGQCSVREFLDEFIPFYHCDAEGVEDEAGDDYIGRIFLAFCELTTYPGFEITEDQFVAAVREAREEWRETTDATMNQ